MPKTFEDFQHEYNRLWNWRDLWNRLGARKPKNWRSTLQSRDEAVQHRAMKADNKIRNLMLEYDRTAVNW